MTDDNKEAMLSSVMVGLAYGLIACTLACIGGLSLTGKLIGLGGGFIAGLALGLSTTWDVEDK